MGKKLILAVAGSGKTTTIVEEIKAKPRCLIFTYTEANAHNLRGKIRLRYGGIPPSVRVLTYFSFLHTFCFRPIVGYKVRNRGLGFSELPHRDRYKQSDDRYFLDEGGRLYHSRLSKYLIARDLVSDVIERIDQFFDLVCVDEVQDFAGNDFNFLLALTQAKADVLLVGDFRQHTYDTSRDRSVNRGLHDSFNSYIKRFMDVGIEIDRTSHSLSHRCSPAVCEFISHHLGIPIGTTSERQSSVIEVRSQNDAQSLWERQDIVKLFYQEHSAYGCHSQNWGASKGEDHHDEVCVVLNAKTLKLYRDGMLASLSPGSLNKLYVALSRSRGDVYLVSHVLLDPYKSQ